MEDDYKQVIKPNTYGENVSLNTVEDTVKSVSDATDTSWTPSANNFTLYASLDNIARTVGNDDHEPITFNCVFRKSFSVPINGELEGRSATLPLLFAAGRKHLDRLLNAELDSKIEDLECAIKCADGLSPVTAKMLINKVRAIKRGAQC